MLSASNGIDYGYRDTGDGSVPLILLQHFRGNLDKWDPTPIDALAWARRVVPFDNAGVGGSRNHCAHRHAGLLGFSIGRFAAVLAFSVEMAKRLAATHPRTEGDISHATDRHARSGHDCGHRS